MKETTDYMKTQIEELWQALAEEAQKHGKTRALVSQLLDACKAWEKAEKNGGVSMADYRTIASNKIRAAIAAAEGRAE